MREHAENDRPAMCNLAKMHLEMALECLLGFECDRAKANAKIAWLWLAKLDSTCKQSLQVDDEIAPVVLGQGDYRREIWP